MEPASSDLEVKYQKLASEYSKVRSQLTVLKKAVIDEQAKNNEMKDNIKECEQKIRKRDQEMDSLNFRNEQLLKRIAVLQQELQNSNSGKKSKHKNAENNTAIPTFTVFDEELQKKILENAQLMSAMADKDLEIHDNNDKISSLEKQIIDLKLELKKINLNHQKELEKVQSKINALPVVAAKNEMDAKQINFWQTETERWRNECKLLRSKPDSNEQLTLYYETQIREILESKQLCQSEASSLWAENSALASRLEGIVIEKNQIETNLEKQIEELKETAENYKSQLDAMTEHLAAQNEKITDLSDEVQVLRHKLSNKR